MSIVRCIEQSSKVFVHTCCSVCFQCAFAHCFAQCKRGPCPQNRSRHGSSGGAFVVSPFVLWVVGWGGWGGNVPGARKKLLLASVAFDWFVDDLVVRIEGPCVCGPLSMRVMRLMLADACCCCCGCRLLLPLRLPLADACCCCCGCHRRLMLAACCRDLLRCCRR